MAQIIGLILALADIVICFFGLLYMVVTRGFTS